MRRRAREPAPREVLYDAVGAGMSVYAHLAFRMRVIGGPVRLRRRLVILATHRRLTDPPLLIGALYVSARAWREREARPWFAVRDDFFQRGALAYLAPRAPLAVRRALFAVDPDPLLRSVRCLPASSWTTMRAAQALAALPADARLADVLPGSLVEQIRDRAGARGLPTPEAAADVFRAEYVDLLWYPLDRDEDCWPQILPAWERRAAAAIGDLRRIVRTLASGEPLVLFPEGRISRDGSIGPVRRGARAVFRRGGPATLLPVGIAYDPLTTGRTRAYVALGDELGPPEERIQETLLAALRRAMPLTRGQVVARELLAAADRGRPALAVGALEDAVAEQVSAAADERRPVEPGIELGDAVEALERRGLVARRGRELVLDAARCRRDRLLAWLRREFESAREPAL